MNAEEYVKTFDTESETKPPVDVNIIKEDIIANNMKEKKLREEMPENIQVSYFLIKAKDTVNFLANKYQKMS